MVLQLPNLLSLFRIAAIPPLVLLFFLPGEAWRWVAFALFVIAGLTDYLDGWVARRRDAASRLGQFLDPIADKLLVATVVLMLVGFDRIAGFALIPAAVILCRELLISGLREFLAGAAIGMPVTALAKWKTTLQMIALSLLIIGDVVPPLPLMLLGEIGLWLAAVLTVITGYDYLHRGVAAIVAEDRDAVGSAGSRRGVGGAAP